MMNDEITTNNRRLYPNISDSDYYMLSKLRDNLSLILSRHVDTNKNNLVFDYGCGDIPYKSLFSNISHSYTAGDIAGNPLADIIVGEDSTTPLNENYFDVVLSIQVLEHVEDVDKYLQEANRILKKDGLLILSTHGWWTYHPFPIHYWGWTREGLTYILKKNGFIVKDSYWVLGMLAYSYQLRVQCWKGILENRGILCKLIFKIISASYQVLMKISDKLIPDHVAKDNSAVYIMVARK